MQIRALAAGAITLAGALVAMSCTSSTTPTSTDRAACTALHAIYSGATATTPDEGRQIVELGRNAHDPQIRQAAADLQRNADAADQAGVNHAIQTYTRRCIALHLEH